MLLLYHFTILSMTANTASTLLILFFICGRVACHSVRHVSSLSISIGFRHVSLGLSLRHESWASAFWPQLRWPQLLSFRHVSLNFVGASFSLDHVGLCFGLNFVAASAFAPLLQLPSYYVAQLPSCPVILLPSYPVFLIAQSSVVLFFCHVATSPVTITRLPHCSSLVITLLIVHSIIPMSESSHSEFELMHSFTHVTPLSLPLYLPYS